MSHLLINYASRFGSTAEVAAAVAETARIECDIEVTIRPISEFESPEPYDALMIGTAIYADQWLPDVEDYLHQYQQVLQRKPLVYFVV